MSWDPVSRVIKKIGSQAAIAGRRTFGWLRDGSVPEWKGHPMASRSWRWRAAVDTRAASLAAAAAARGRRRARGIWPDRYESLRVENQRESPQTDSFEAIAAEVVAKKAKRVIRTRVETVI
jgi:hypothetical protein